MIDRYNRKITYLRLSVTDRCNLNCIYCSPDSGKQCRLLTAEQIERTVRAFCEIGVNKIRITGGEPLVRADIIDIITRISKIDGVTELPMTTNGVRLYELAQQLVDAGVTRLNVSLDTLRPERFKHIAGRDKFYGVINGIERMHELGIGIKINIVLVKGINDDEISDFIEITKVRPYAVRFIELMPIGHFGENNADKIITGDDILAMHPELVRKKELDDTVSETYVVPGWPGKVGFISPMTHKFCGTCNRVRLTADGKLKPCLGSNGETDLYEVIRDGSYDELKEAIKTAVYNKPCQHEFEKGFTSDRDMGHIGG